ncbi:extracellular solute-binding protein [Paenibacillus sp. TRM 82003]|nr:extracellular solute-binding protein [Paenibacillus sp. TRM 82003]
MLTGCGGASGTGEAGRVREQRDADTRDAWKTLRVELFDRNNTPIGAPPITDNFMTQYIQEHFGDPNRIKVEFVTVPRAEELDRLHVLMAANQAPDLVFTYDLPTVYNFGMQGKLADLTALLDEHGQDLKRVLGEDILEVGRFDGKQYAIPAKRVLTAQSVPLIRQDWLEEVGLPLPETTEQFYEALKAFKEKRPGKSGDRIIPFGHIDYYHTSGIQYSFWDWDRITEEDVYANPRWVMPGNKEAFRFLNKLYHEGLLDPNFHLDRFSQQFQKDLVNGLVGAGTPNVNEPVYMGYLGELRKLEPNAVLTPIDPFTDTNGKRPKPILEKNGMLIMVPKASPNAAEAIKYLNWMAQKENYIALQNGMEGVTYTMKNGNPVTLQNEEAKRTLYNYFDYCIILNGKFVSATDDELNVKANIADDSEYEEFTKKSIEYGMRDGVETPQIMNVLPAEIKYASSLTEKNEEIFVKVITAEPEAFDAVYDQEVADYLRMGGRQVMEEKRQAYREYRESR